MMSLRWPPAAMPGTPSSHPGITWPLPTVKLKGWLRGRLESNTVPSASHPVYCTIMADPPAKSTAGSAIEGDGRYRCDSPGADSLTMNVALQQRGAGGQWTTVAAQQFTVAGAATTRALTEKQRTRTVAVPCGTGTYRVVADSAWLTRGSRKAFKMTGPQVANPCRGRG